MAGLWVAASLLIGLWHITALPAIFNTIFRCAFGWQEAAAGAVGYTISQALTAVFSAECSLTKRGWAQRLTPPRPPPPGLRTRRLRGCPDDWRVYRYRCYLHRQPVIIMLAPRARGEEDAANGIQAIQHAMSGLVGGWGAGFVAVIVLLFAFSSIVANYIYAENNLIFLRFNSPRCIWTLRIITILMVLTGTMIEPPGRLAAGGYYYGADGHYQPDGHPPAVTHGAAACQRPIFTSDGSACSPRLTPRAIRKFASSWRREPGTGPPAANSAAIAAIDPPAVFFLVKSPKISCKDWIC
ncbi:Na+/alanine symporter [Raoultella terrigena]|uniref:Na+/alanine symporter n=1 Tax=Raoultella terrigena TaxID=577 RepID=A0A4U9DC16_RAOTE|nr:Na+/alanine symporter [Raoultella terrigena]